MGSERRQKLCDNLPLAVDLDGTLVPIDTLHEGMFAALRSDRNGTFEAVKRITDGKAVVKRGIAERAGFDPALLPYNETLLNYLREQKERGRKIGLFTAADQSIADAVATYLGLFDVVRGSDGAVNLSGTRKLAVINEEFGERFAYAGDAPVDAPLFAAAAAVILVGPIRRLERFVRPGTVIEACFPVERAGVQTWARALRVSHWAKNALVFVAPALGLGLLDPAVVISAVILFVSLGLLASATYLLNDLLDLSADREHPQKRFRPIAAGQIPALDAVAVGIALGVAAFALAAALPLYALLAVAGYLVVTLAYSLLLKREPIIDVFVLASLFTLRVYAGSTLLPEPASPWLLTFSMLFFLGLAMVKRYAELDRVVRSGGEAVVSRGYTSKDLPLVVSAGIASGFGAIGIMMMYLMAEQYPSGVYARPELLWGLMPLILLWTLRIWHLAVHGRMSEDPVVFAMRDKFSLSLGLFALMILLFSWWPA